jgi:hypothetical protein
MDEYEVWSQLWRMTRLGEKRPHFIGLPLADAEETARTEHLKVRVFGPPTQVGLSMTAEYAPNRRSLLVRDGIVIDAAVCQCAPSRRTGQAGPHDLQEPGDPVCVRLSLRETPHADMQRALHSRYAF